LQAYGSQTELAPINNVTADMNNMPVVAANQTFTAVRTQGNPDLKPQTATTFTAGLEWAPVKGLFLQGDYWNYKYEDIIVKQNAQQLVAADFLDKSNPQVHRGVGGIPEQVDVRFINATSVLTHGIDLEAIYRTNFGAQAGTFSFGGSSSYTFAYYIPRAEVALAGTPDVDCNKTRCNVAGSRNFANFARPIPRLRFNIPVSWTLDRHTATIIGHFISGYKDDQNPNAMSRALPDIKPWFTLDLQYQFKLQETNRLSTTFKVGISNVLDTLPPTVKTGFGYDTYTHDPRGRLIYGRLIQEL
jgi:iron complex outermembrane receptor protein